MSFKKQICAMNCHYRFYELEDFFRYVHRCGIQNAEIWSGPMHYYVDHRTYEPVEKLRALSQKYQVNIIGICPEQTNPKPNHPAVKEVWQQERVYAYYSNMIDIAAQIGCYQVLMTSGWAYYSERREDAWERSVGMMKRIAEYAKKRQVRLALEALQPQESCLVNSIEDMRKYLWEVDSDNLYVCIDFGAMARSGDTLEDYFRTFQNRILHIHFVDGSPIGHLAWGDGSRNLQEDLACLRKYGYQGYLSLETASPRYFEKPWEAEEKTLRELEKWEGTL